jgi:hypothetical protein
MEAAMSEQKQTPADPVAALEWAIIARQRELGKGAPVSFETLEADPIWLALAKLSKEARDGR